MHKIDWNLFKVKNENSTKSFEELCYMLFSREHKFPNGLPADFNQAGLETFPQQSNTLNKIVGFQAKFFENKTDYGQIKKSVEKAVHAFTGTLEEITIYVNSNITLSSNRVKEITAIAQSKNVKIHWFTQSMFQVTLNQPCNYDLAQLYFNLGDEDGFLRSNLTLKDSSFIQSGSFLALPIIKLPTKQTVDLNLEGKLSLLTGNPGSGKTVVVKSLFCKYAKLFESRSLYEKNVVLPMLVNLKDCYSENLESLIRERQKDYRLRNKNVRFIYLLDGLDELDDMHCELSLRFIKKLSELKETEHILISCRSGSLNKLQVSEFFEFYDRYEIDVLTFEHIEKYFHQKGDLVKNDKLTILKKHNGRLLDDITDIFLIKLLWDTFSDLTEHSTSIDLLHLKMDSLLKRVRHRNNIAELNLLMPKENAILRLNEKLSYQFSKRYQYRFTHSTINKFISKNLPKLDYNDINKISNYLLNTFFDNSGVVENYDSSYIYQHRRYQEYFFARHLKRKFEKDITVIRRTGIILNTDFFDNFFMKFLRNEYKKVNDLPSLILLSSIDFYQNSGDAWYVRDSPHFINNLAYQKDRTLEILMGDDVLNTKQYINGTYENALIFYQKGKQSLAEELITQCSETMWQFENTTSLKELEGQLFYKFTVLEKGKNNFVSYFQNSYRNFYLPFYTSENSLLDNQSPQEYVIKSYFSVGLKHLREELLALIPELSDTEFVFLLDLLSTIEFLHMFFDDKDLQDKISLRMVNYRRRPVRTNLALFFFKRLLNQNITEKQMKASLEALRPIMPNVSEYSFVRHIHPFALCYVIVGESNFMKERNSMQDFPAVDEVVKYCTLYNFYCKNSVEKNSFLGFLSYYKNRFKGWYDSRPRIKAQLSKLWAHVFYGSKGDRTNLTQLFNMLTFDLEPFIFLTFLNKVDNNYFAKIVTEAALVPFESTLNGWKQNYSEYIDRCFILSGMYSQLNSDKSFHYFKEGFINSKLRHGWRKDTFVSDFFNSSFAIVLEKNWLSPDEVLKIAESVFELNIRLYEVTDRDHTRYGILEFLEALGSYNVKLAYKYYRKFKKLKLDNHIERLSHVAIIKHDIKNNALPYVEIERKLNHWEFNNHNYAQKRFEIIIEVLDSDFYGEEVKDRAFEMAHSIVESINGKFDYQYGILGHCFDVYSRYCQIYKKVNGIQIDLEEDKTDNKVSESEFRSMINNVSNRSQLKELYSFFNNYNNEVSLSEKQIWRSWIEKTVHLDHNIDLFIELLKEKGFLSTGLWDGHNIEYLHLGVACCLENPNCKEQMENFLADNGGYGGFYKMISVYAAMDEKERAMDLFNKFFRFCSLLLF